MVGRGTELADLYLPIRVNGDLALFQAIGRAAACEAGRASTTTSSREHTDGFDELRRAPAPTSTGTTSLRATGLTARADRARPAGCSPTPSATIVCWAMGLTQHRNAVATIKEIVNVALLQGNIGKPGAGLCPVRGHSNVQGDRTMGIWEKAAGRTSSTRCATSSASSRRASTASTPSTRSGRCATARRKVFVGWAATSSSATPDTEVTEDGVRSAA